MADRGLSLAGKTLIVIAGPTAVGKTALAINIAQHYKTEIVSADSRQFYREMAIGTAKPDEDELAAVPHHFVNSHTVTDDFSAGAFEKEGLKLLDTLFTRLDTVVMVGGSGLFIKAICEGFDQLPDVDAAIRERLNAAYAQNGIEWLQTKLQAADPVYYQKVDTSNPQRLIRALEVMEQSGRPFSSFHTQNLQARNFSSIKIGLNLPRELLYSRINQRVDAMMAHGLLDEVRALLPYRHLNTLHTVGYTELFNYLDGNTNLEAAIALIKQNTRRFAKRQLTWFGKDKEMSWFAPDATSAVIAFIDSKIQ